ncbi:MAG: hypothetical protein JEZ00_03195 [Anaerolineaceae bacterium]|nr:hypothetical protein [Anaerolineaceae bacterium]
MNLQQIIDQLSLSSFTEPKNYSEIVPGSGYCSDLLSCVMTGAKSKGLWITLQAHSNIVAVAALLEISAIVITEGAIPDPATIKKANEENIILLGTSEANFEVVGKLWSMGLRNQ